jgi:hypothetical protein
MILFLEDTQTIQNPSSSNNYPPNSTPTPTTDELEKELNLNVGANMPVSQPTMLNEDYEKFLQTPQMNDYMNSYYYTTGNDDNFNQGNNE